MRKGGVGLMGYPHKPHAKETALLSKHFGDPDARTYKGWAKRGGYEAWKQAQTMAPAAITDVVKESGLRGRGGAGLPTGGTGEHTSGLQSPCYLACRPLPA